MQVLNKYFINDISREIISFIITLDKLNDLYELLTHQCIFLWDEKTETEKNNYIVNSSCQGELIFNGPLNVLKWLFKNKREKCGVAQQIDSTARNGHLDIIEWLLDKNNKDLGFFCVMCSYSAINGAAKNGYLDVVKFLYKSGKNCDPSAAIDAAAKNNHLHVIKWIYENVKSTPTINNSFMKYPMECTLDAINWATENGHLETVKWLHENMKINLYPPYSHTMFPKVALNIAAFKGHLDIVKFLYTNRRNDYIIDEAINWATIGGYRNIANWLRTNKNN